MTELPQQVIDILKEVRFLFGANDAWTIWKKLSDKSNDILSKYNI